MCHVQWVEITTCSVQEEDSTQTVVTATLSAETLQSAKVETPGDAKPKPTPPPSPLLSSLLQNNQALLEALQKQQQVKVIFTITVFNNYFPCDMYFNCIN